MSVASRVAAHQQAGTIELYRDDTGEWHWQAITRDGEITVHPEGYIRKTLAKQAARQKYLRWPLTSTRHPTPTTAKPKPASKTTKKK